ncbi:MAG: hypothetical protein AB7L66_01700 [Gemmatimonadales bacterium]
MGHSAIRRALVALFLGTALGACGVAAQEPDFNRGLEQLQAGLWAQAETTFARLVGANPFDGAARLNLAVALSRRNECGRAIPQLEEAIRLGVNGRRLPGLSAHFTLAGCLIVGGDTGRGLAHLDTAWRRYGLRDFSIAGERFARVKASDRFRAMAGDPGEPIAGRVARWRFDLAYLDRLVRATHPAPFHAMPETDWAAAVARIDRDLERLTDDEIIAAVMALLASVGDGHTALFGPPPGSWRQIPIWPVHLVDGWYVGAAAPAYRSLVGGRILGIGSRSIAAVDSAARRLIAHDNEWTARWLAQVPLQTAEFYRLAGVADPDGAVTVRIETPAGAERTISVTPAGFDHDPADRWAPAAWPTMVVAGAEVPRWIRYAARPVAIEWMKRERVLYVAVNAVADQDDRTFGAVGEQVRDSIIRYRAAGVVLDLRLNNGGNGSLVPSFLAPLVGLDVFRTRAAVQVLTGPRTYSAAGFLLNELDRYSEAERVGWPTGVRPVAYGTETPFRLPLSGLTGSVATRLEVAGVSADDTRPFFAPRIAVWPTGADVREGRDPVLEAALARIKSQP